MYKDKVMDQKLIDTELKNFKIREGSLYKRSKFLKEWRQRWIVLTMNYLFTFTSKTYQEVTDVIDLKDIKSYKSYVRKDEEMIPAGFKIRTQENMYYFCARNCNEKWSWLVTFQRLMDVKYAGASTYNNIDFIRTRGFPSQVDFENGAKPENIAPEVLTKSKEEVQKDVDKEAEKIMKQLMQQQEQLKRKEEEVQRKEKQLHQQEAMFILEKDKLKKTESESVSPQKVETTVETTVQTKVETKVETTVETKIQTKIQTKAEAKVQTKVEAEKTPQIPHRDTGGKVSELKHLFEKKIEDNSKSVGPSIKLNAKEEKKIEANKGELLHLCRNKVVTNLFQEFHREAYTYEGLKYIIDFLVKISSQRSLGYQSYMVYEAKTNDNRAIFAEIFIELLTNFRDYDNVDLICRFVEVMIFQAPGLFNLPQLQAVQTQLLTFFKTVSDEKKLGVVLKSLFIMHKIKPTPKQEQLKIKLDKLVKECKWEQTRNWARKIYDDL